METRTVAEILSRIDEIHEVDVTGERECELMRWVPPEQVPRHAAYRRDRGNLGDARPGSAPARAGYLLQRAQDVWDGPYSQAGRQEVSMLLRRAEEALWVAGADAELLEQLRRKHLESPRLLLDALRGVKRTLVPQ